MTEKEIFESAIRKWHLQPDRQLTMNQVAAWALGSGTSSNAAKAGRMLYQFSEYFHQISRNKWSVRWEAVKKDYPQLVGSSGKRMLLPIEKVRARQRESVETRRIASREKVFNEMIQALDDEIRAIRKEQNENPVLAIEITNLGRIEDKHLYKFRLDFKTDIPFPIPEGVGVWIGRPSDGGCEGKLLAYDPLTSTAIVESNRKLESRFWGQPVQILPRVDELVESIKVQLNRLKERKGSCGWRIFEPQYQPRKTTWTGTNILRSGLDASQNRALQTCLGQDITFLWGPPGTGKTFMLARAIASAALSGKKVLAVAISNVAVDQLAIKVVEALRSCEGRFLLSNGKVLRFGYAMLREVLDEPLLFPLKREIQQLREFLNRAMHELRDIPRSDIERRAAKVKFIDTLREQIREAQKQAVEGASIVLTTAVQVSLSPFIGEQQFDLTVVDEASMIPIPYLASVGATTNERMIISGDFRQLGPIALSKSDVAFNWLHRDVFRMAGIVDGSGKTNMRHPALAMLTVQRRMHKNICALINHVFYEGNLRTETPEKHTRAKKLKPLPGVAAVFVSTEGIPDCEIEQTEGGSRRNKGTAAIVVSIVKMLFTQDKRLHIGVIAPYRAQVSYINRLLDQYLSKSLRSQVDVGTVHAFQGREADVVIWDLVEATKPGIKIGLLYRGDAGNRLTNVAISRAKGKLIIVGEDKVFRSGPGYDAVDSKSRTILTLNFSQTKGNMIPAIYL